MTDRSSQSIVINAGPEAIMDVIADFAAYPQWALAVKKAEALIPGAGDRAERVRFSLDAGLVKDVFVLDYVWSEDGLAVAWELVEGQIQKAQHGSYVLAPLSSAEPTRAVPGRRSRAVLSESAPRPVPRPPPARLPTRRSPVRTRP